MMKKQMNNILLVLALLCCALQSGAASFSGSGTATDPYLIQSLADLKAFAKSVYDGTSYEGKYFKQTADIVVNENVIKSDGTFNSDEKSKFINWKPAGRVYGMFTEKAFQGNYDGGNHSISGLYFGDDLDEAYVGLFAYVKGAILQNITIKDSYMGCKAAGSYNDNYHGFLVGLAYTCTILNCHVSNCVMDVIPNREVYSGGLVGAESRSKNNGALTMKDCSFSGKINVKTQSSDVYVAGLVGSHYGGKKSNTKMRDCSVEGSLNLIFDCSKSCDRCFVSGFANNKDDYQLLDMYNCVNRMTFDVEGVNFVETNNFNNLGPEYETIPSQYKHLKKLYIHPMATYVNVINNCADFGQVNIGTSSALGPVDDIVVAPVGYIAKAMASCAFYGITKVGYNGYMYDKQDCDMYIPTWKEVYSPKVYILASKIEADATIGRVLRREDVNAESEGKYFLQDKDSSPMYVDLYAPDLAEILKNAAKIVKNYSSSLDAANKYSSWGFMTDETFKGCPAPTAVGGVANTLLGEGTLQSPYLIQDEKDYQLAVNSINTMDTSDKYYKLTADIDLSNSGEFEPLGYLNYPFKGTFDGDGHAIIGLNVKYGSMFDNVKGGYVENLTLLDMTCSGTSSCCPLVEDLTPSEEGFGGYIENCYVGGNINVNLYYPTSTIYSIAGLCRTCKGGKIKNSYFKGKFNIKNSGEEYRVYLGGICYQIEAYENIKSEISDCYSIFDYSNPDDKCSIYPYGIACQTGKIPEDALEQSNLYYMTNSDKVDTENGIRATSYADIKMSQTSSFIDGVYNPVLPDTKSYKLADGRGLDAILVDGEGTGDNANVILHYVPSAGEDYQSDRYLWQHPNLAVYNADDDAEYLINCTLDNAKDLQLNMDKAKSQTIKANMHYPVSIYSDYNDKPLLQMLCLPVTVQCDALPEGSKLKIVGTKSYDKTNNRYLSTMVECDSVPAGVPFLLEVPAEATSADKNATYDLVLRGKVAAEPVSAIKVGDLSLETELKGTYASIKKTGYQVLTHRDECIAKDGYYDVYKYANTVSPFHAYAIVGSDTDTPAYHLIDNLLLDEESADVASMLQTYNGKSIGVVLKRTMKTNVWNTVCLPFDLSAEEISTAFGDNTQVEELNNVEKPDGVATLRFVATTSGMKAGKTYLVKPTKSGTLYNFSDKEIKNELASDPEDAASKTYFKGTFAPMMLEGTAEQTADGYSYNYFIQSNKLYYLPEGKAVALKGFRGWILIASNSLFGDGSASSARLVHFDGTTTGIRAIEYGTTSDGMHIYNLQGVETGEPVAPGIYIKNGKKYVKK